jgi:hypothetical protein
MGNGPMISLTPSLIFANHSMSSRSDLLAKPRHAQGISAQLAMWTRPSPCDVKFTSRCRQSSESIELRTYFADASVDQTNGT